MIFNVGSVVDKWLAMLPHSKNVIGLNPGQIGAFLCGSFNFSLFLLVLAFFRVFLFAHRCESEWCSEQTTTK